MPATNLVIVEPSIMMVPVQAQVELVFLAVELVEVLQAHTGGGPAHPDQVQAEGVVLVFLHLQALAVLDGYVVEIGLLIVGGG